MILDDVLASDLARLLIELGAPAHVTPPVTAVDVATGRPALPAGQPHPTRVLLLRWVAEVAPGTATKLRRRRALVQPFGIPLAEGMVLDLGQAAEPRLWTVSTFEGVGISTGVVVWRATLNTGGA